MALPTTLNLVLALQNLYAGPFKGANGNFYVFGRKSSNAAILVVDEASDPTDSWTLLPNEVNVGAAITSYWVYQDQSDNDVFHVVTQESATGNNQVSYHKIDVGVEAGVLSADSTASKHYKHSGFSATISSSYASPSSTPRGLSWDGTNVLSTDGATGKHYKHSGFSATISSSYASPSSEPRGLSWDGTNVLSTDGNADKHYKHGGFSATISSRYASPNSLPQGLSWDGTNVLSADSNADKHYKHSGFSATISSSYASPSSVPQGLSWDGTNVLSADSTAEKHYKHSGFSATISSSYASPSSTPRGLSWAAIKWLTTNQNIQTGMTLGGVANERACSIAVRSDGDIIVLYQGATDKVHGTDYNRVDYARREGSTWTVGVDVTGGTGNQVHYYGCVIVKGSGDNMHFFWRRNDNNNINGRTLDPSANTLSTIRTQSAASATLLHTFRNGVSYNDAGTQRVIVPYKGSANHLRVWRHTEDGSGDLADTGSLTQVSDTSNEVLANLDNPVASSALEGTSQMHLLWSRNSDSDLYHDEAAAPQSLWGTDTELIDATTIVRLNANVYTRSGATVLAYAYTITAGGDKYNELELVAAPSGGTNRRALIGVGR
jgi:hypothetical protein